MWLDTAANLVGSAQHNAPVCLHDAHGPFPAGHPHNAELISHDSFQRHIVILYIVSFFISG